MSVRKLRRGVVASVAACCMVLSGAGAALAAPVDFLPWPLPVWGGEVSQPDRQVDKTTIDGWGLHVRKTNERLHIAPPLDSAVTTAEAYGNVDFAAWVDGKGNPKLDGAKFEAGYQIGCGISMPDGVALETGSTLGSSPFIHTGVEGGPSIKAELPIPPKFVIGAEGKGKIETGIDGEAKITQTIKTELKPGEVNDVVLVSKDLDPEFQRAAGGFEGAHLQVTGCIGPVTARSFARIGTSTKTSTDVLTVYGDPQRIR